MKTSTGLTYFTKGSPQAKAHMAKLRAMAAAKRNAGGSLPKGLPWKKGGHLRFVCDTCLAEEPSRKALERHFVVYKHGKKGFTARQSGFKVNPRNFKKLTWEQWEKLFQPELASNGDLNWLDWTVPAEWKRIQAAAKRNILWTEVSVGREKDGKSNVALIEGFHYVNRMQYIITKKPYPRGAHYEVIDKDGWLNNPKRSSGPRRVNAGRGFTVSIASDMVIGGIPLYDDLGQYPTLAKAQAAARAAARRSGRHTRVMQTGGSSDISAYGPRPGGYGGQRGHARMNVSWTPARRIAAFRKIVADKQHATIDGTMVDLFSASHVVQVYDALNATNQAKYASYSAPKMASIAFKLVKKNPHIVIDPATNRIQAIERGHPMKSFGRAQDKAQFAAQKLGRRQVVVAHPYVPKGFKKGVEVSPLFYHYGSVEVDGQGKVYGNPRRKRNPTEAYSGQWFDAGKALWDDLDEREAQALAAMLQENDIKAKISIDPDPKKFGAHRFGVYLVETPGDTYSKIAVQGVANRFAQALSEKRMLRLKDVPGMEYGSMVYSRGGSTKKMKGVLRRIIAARNPLDRQNAGKMDIDGHRLGVAYGRPSTRGKRLTDISDIQDLALEAANRGGVVFVTEDDAYEFTRGFVRGYTDTAYKVKKNPLDSSELMKLRREAEMVRMNADEALDDKRSRARWNSFETHYDRLSGILSAVRAIVLTDRQRRGLEAKPKTAAVDTAEYIERQLNLLYNKAVHAGVWQGAMGNPRARKNPIIQTVMLAGMNPPRYIGDLKEESSEDIRHDLAMYLADGYTAADKLVAAMMRELKKRGAPLPREAKWVSDPYARFGRRLTYKNKVRKNCCNNPRSCNCNPRELHEIHLTSTPMFYTPGILRWAMNGYRFKGDRAKMVRVFVDGYKVPRSIAIGLLSGKIPHRVVGEDVVFSTRWSPKGKIKPNPLTLRETARLAKSAGFWSGLALKAESEGPLYRGYAAGRAEGIAETITKYGPKRGRRVADTIRTRSSRALIGASAAGVAERERRRKLGLANNPYEVRHYVGGRHESTQADPRRRGMVTRFKTKAEAREVMREIGATRKAGYRIAKTNPAAQVNIPWKEGQKIPIDKARAWVNSMGDPELVRQFEEAYKLQCTANRKPEHVVWQTIAIGSPRRIDAVTAMVQYGDSPETMYKPPQGSKKGPHMYRHEWGEGKKGGRKSVPLLAAPGGKAVVMPMGKGQTVGDWMRG